MIRIMMKNKLYVAGLILAATFASCADESNELVSHNATVAVSAEMNSQSRTELGDDSKTITWCQGDQIYLFDADGKTAGKLNLTDGAGETTATFKGTVTGTFANVDKALYPVPTASGSEYTFDFPAERTWSENSAAPMIGDFSNNHVSFRNLAAMVRIALDGYAIDANSVLELTMIGQTVTGTATVDVTNEALTFADGGNTVTVTGFGDARFVDIPVPSGDYNGYTLSLNGIQISAAEGLLETLEKDDVLIIAKASSNSKEIANQANIDDLLKNNDDAEIINISLSEDVTVDVEAWKTDPIGGASITKVIIEGNGHTLTFNQTNSDWNNIILGNSDAILVLNNVNITNSGHNDGPWNRHDLNFACNVEMNSVISDKALAFKAGATLNNVTINDDNTSDTYAIWIQPNGQTVALDNCLIDMIGCTDGRGIKIDEQYVDSPSKVTLNVSNITFKTEEKSAIVVKSRAGADITLSNIDITEVEADKVCEVWVDEEAPTTYDLVKVIGGNKRLEGKEYYSDAEGNIIVSSAKGITDAINGFNRDVNIIFMNDIEGDAIALQKENVAITIDGNNHKLSGTITVDGKSATILTAGLTIKNLDFKAENISADACINMGAEGNNATRYICNLTVEGCTFDVPGAVGVKSYTGGDKNLTIKGCTATTNAHSLIQAKGIDGVLIEGCYVYSKNGMNFNNSVNVNVIGCEADVQGYAVRFGEGSAANGAAETYSIKNCTLKSACDDGDAVIILRGTADLATLTIENTTIEGTLEITNNATGATVNR